jgi:WD40 repeat protein
VSLIAEGIPYQAKIHPGDENILAACSDKNIVQWDPRQSTDDSLVQEYIQHLGSVNTINFYDDYRRVVSTGVINWRNL